MASDFFYDKPDKKWNIDFESGEKIENSDIYLSDGIQIQQTLCSHDQIKFGSCISDYATIKLINTGESYSGKNFTLSIEADGTVCMIGQFKVLKEELSEDKSSRTVTAYDKMADILERDVTEWFNGLTFPVTIRELRNSFCEFVGVEQAAGSWLLFDTLSVQKTISPQSMTGKAFMTKLCEMNGCFGHINPDGKMEYVYLDALQQAFYLDTGSCIKETHEDYEVQKIDKLQIRTEENDIGCVYGTGENCYIIQDNFFFYGMSADELNDCATKIYNVISKLSYTPFAATCAGNPTFRPGECLRVPSKHGAYITYMLERVLKGTISLRDDYEAKGKRIRSEKANGVNEDILALKGKTAKLTRTVSGIISEIYDSETGTSRISQNAQSITAEVIRASNAEKNLQTKIEQTAESISLKVSKDSIISEINQTAEEIKIIAGKIDLEGLVSATEFTSKFATIEDLDATNLAVSGKASIGSLNAVSGRVGTLEADHVSVSSLNAVSGRVGTLEADHVSVSSLNAVSGRVKTIESSYITASYITADVIQSKFQSPTSGSLTLGTIRAATIQKYNGSSYVTLVQRTATIGGKTINYIGW